METAVLWLTLIASVCAFNLETRLPVVKLGEKGTYFGYSVSEHQAKEGDTVTDNFLLTGAPRAQTTQPGTNRSGAVYRCPLTTWFKDCQQLDVETERKPPDDDILKDGQWLGVTVRSQGPGGDVLVCAHRYVLKGDTFRWGNGICYTLDQYLEFYRQWEPCANRPVDKAHEQFGFCAAGTSGLITEDSTIVVGTPGPYTWKGTIFTIAARRQLDWSWSISPFLDSEAPVEKYSYLGMAVTSGRFINGRMTYIAGAPRSNGTGRVVFFTKNDTSTLQTELILQGEQFASSFGYSLTSLDLNKDGFIDLVVGAPFYHGKGEGGAIYIYLNSREGISTSTKPTKIVGKDESRFGFGLSSAGDLNRDGCQDLAVGAPYEEGGGAIYIYLGSEEGIVKEPAQVIRPSQLPKEVLARTRVTTLGYSLFGGMDLDSNGYPDLLVGNYEADNIILFRSRPIIDIVTSVTGNLTNIDPNQSGCYEDPGSRLVCFGFTACFRVVGSSASRRPAQSQLKLEYRIEAETFASKKYYRVRLNNTEKAEQPNIVTREYRVTIGGRDVQHCFRELAYLKDKSDIQSPIKFKLTYTLMQKEPRFPQEGDSLPEIANFPILNRQEASKIFEARFLKNCSHEDYCESDLHIEADLILPKEAGVPVLFLGEEYVNMSVTVYNRKEPAYDAFLYIAHSPALSYAKVVKSPADVKCLPVKGNTTLLRCELGNPLNQGKVELYLRFQALREADTETYLNFVLSANTTSHEISPQGDVNIDVSVVRVAELELRGATLPEQVWYGGPVVGARAMTYLDEIGSEVSHTYQVYNRGPWTVPQLEIVVTWPYEVENNYEHGKYLLYMTEDPKVAGDGECIMEKDQVNPLGLRNRNSPQSPPSRTRSRQKREVVVPPEEVRLEGKTIKLVTMKCDRRSAKCFQFRCVLRNLKKGSPATVTIVARLWNATLVEDYPSVDQVSIFSSAEIRLDPALEIRQRTEDDYAVAETRAYPDASLYQKPEGVALWIIILAVCIGILLLILVIFILYKVGFFKRKRPREGYSPAPTSDKEFNRS